MRTSYQRPLHLLRFVLTTAFFVMVFESSMVQAYHIPTGSMEPTVLVGDRVVVNRFVFGPRTPDHVPVVGIDLPAYRFPGLRTPRTGDIVVLSDPRGTPEKLLKRCVAGPGQTVEVRAKRLYVDGVLLEEPYVHPTGDPRIHRPGVPDSNPWGRKEIAQTWGPERGSWNRDHFGPVTVPPDRYFMMGDNRDRSSDSRYWGFVHEDEVLGKAMAVYYSGDADVPWWNLVERVRWERVGRVLG